MARDLLDACMRFPGPLPKAKHHKSAFRIPSITRGLVSDSLKQHLKLTVFNVKGIDDLFEKFF
jgi:hypothetical protein